MEGQEHNSIFDLILKLTFLSINCAKLIFICCYSYGDKRAGSIPPNSWLVFDVELINVS